VSLGGRQRALVPVAGCVFLGLGDGHVERRLGRGLEPLLFPDNAAKGTPMKTLACV
jgi:hypothetical protein